jgi:hypothetical protein
MSLRRVIRDWLRRMVDIYQLCNSTLMFCFWSFLYFTTSYHGILLPCMFLGQVADSLERTIQDARLQL